MKTVAKSLILLGTIFLFACGSSAHKEMNEFMKMLDGSEQCAEKALKKFTDSDFDPSTHSDGFGDFILSNPKITEHMGSMYQIETQQGVIKSKWEVWWKVDEKQQPTGKIEKIKMLDGLKLK